MSTWEDVGTALLGSWPSQVAAWGPDAINSYVDELRHRGLDPDQALVGIRTQQGPFPPSAGEVAKAALADPSVPTFEEMFRLVYGPRGVLKARPREHSWPSLGERERAYEQAALERAAEMHPLVWKFVTDERPSRLRSLELNDDEHGELRRRELRESWERLVKAYAGREIRVIASGEPREGLRRFDPLAALGLETQELPMQSEVTR